MGTEARDQGRRAAGRIGWGDREHLDRTDSFRDFEDLALVATEVGKVGPRNELIGRGRERLPQHRAGAVPDENRNDRGEASLPGAATRWRQQPERGGDDEEDAEGGADRVGHDIAHAGVAARDPLLQEFDGERQRRAGHDDAPWPHAGEGEGDAERDEEEQVLDQFREGGVAGGEGEVPAAGQVGAAGAQGKIENGGCGERSGRP